MSPLSSKALYTVRWTGCRIKRRFAFFFSKKKCLWHTFFPRPKFVLSSYDSRNLLPTFVLWFVLRCMGASGASFLFPPPPLLFLFLVPPLSLLPPPFPHFSQQQRTQGLLRFDPLSPILLLPHPLFPRCCPHFSSLRSTPAPVRSYSTWDVRLPGRSEP